MSLAGVWYNQNILPTQDTPNGNGCAESVTNLGETHDCEMKGQAQWRYKHFQLSL